MTTVKEFWEELGVSKPAGELVTHKDVNQVAMEINALLKFIEKDDVLLDIGCGTGYSTSVYAKKCGKAVGLDYADAMIQSAQKRYSADNLEFHQQDVLQLKEQYGKFSKIVSTRCLQNLDSWENQQIALKNLHACLEEGGRLLFAEDSVQGRTAISDFRVKMGLSEIPPVWHNVAFDEKKLMPFLEKHFEIEQDIRFGLYDVLTRVYYSLAIHPEQPQYGSGFQQAAREVLESLDKDPFPQYSREFFLVLRKK